MHSERRKELLEAWKDRHPEMGVISFRCNPTDEIFFTTATDIPAKFNRIRFQLSNDNFFVHNLKTSWLLGFPADRFHRASPILLCDLLLGHKYRYFRVF